MFITTFTKARHLSLSWARSIQSTPPSHFSTINFNIILSSMAGSSKCSPSLGFPHQDPVCTSTLPTRATCPAHLSLLDLITRMILMESIEHRAPHYRNYTASYPGRPQLNMHHHIWGFDRFRSVTADFRHSTGFSMYSVLGLIPTYSCFPKADYLFPAF